MKLVIITTAAIALLLSHNSSAYAKLAVSPAGSVCVGQEINFSCCRNNSQDSITFLRWTVADLRNQLVFRPNSDSRTGAIRYNGHVFHGILHSITPQFYSTLSITADTQLNGVNVECLTDNSIRETLSIDVAAFAYTRVASPMNLQLTVISNGSYAAKVLFQWTSPVEFASRINYTSDVAIHNSLSNQSEKFSKQIKDSGAIVNVSFDLQYNINYTISVMLSDICIDSNSTAMNALLVNCSTPSLASDVVIDPYTETTEGAEIYFYCDQGFYPNDRVKAICGHNRTWTPNPSHHMCFRASICGPSHSTTNTNHSESLSVLQSDVVAVMFYCNGDTIPSGEFKAICTHNNFQLQCFPYDNGASTDSVTSPDMPGSNSTRSNTSTISVEVFIAATLSCSITFSLIGGLIGLVCGSRCTSMREQVAISSTNDNHVSSVPRETSLRRVQFDFTENVAYATVKHSTSRTQ